MTRSSNGSATIVAGRLVSLLLGAIGGTFWLLTGCTPPPDEGVLAFVNGRQITQTEFDTRWGELAEATRARYKKEGGNASFSTNSSPESCSCRKRASWDSTRT